MTTNLKSNCNPTGNYDNDRKTEWGSADLAIGFRKGRMTFYIDLNQEESVDKYDLLRESAARSAKYNDPTGTKKVYFLSMAQACEVAQEAAKKANPDDVVEMEKAFEAEIEKRNDIKSYDDEYYLNQKNIARSIGYEIYVGEEGLPDDLSNAKIIIGDTYKYKDQIKNAGFRWNKSTKSWFRK